MERFGYLYTEREEQESSYLCAPLKETRIACVKHCFFKNLKDCINDALLFEYFKEKETRFFFKILKTPDVIQQIYDMSRTRVYGYLYLSVTDDGIISLFSSCNTLYSSMLDCVSSEKNCCYEDNNMKDQTIKLAYFMLFKDEDILFELQRPYI